jgi:tetratricopeptide (TPR) repeat protein
MAPGLPEEAVMVDGRRAAGVTGPEAARSGAAATALQPGMRFGRRYHLIRLLGEGGMGAVFQAWDEELAVVVAIKVIRPESLKDAAAARDLERRFKRELLLARNVTHKNVVRIHDLGEIDGVKYITMPYVHGGDLARLLSQEGRLAVPRALNFARQIVGGLVAAHEAGVVHRDLKPGNILLDEEDRALITDFGIARSVTGSGGGTMAGTVVGTLEYMAPEQAQGATVDHRADIYAFGLILRDMLVGRREAAYSATAMAELFARMSNAPPPVRTIDPTIPQAIDEIISRCLDPDPGKRYQTTHELAEDLDAVSGPRTTGSRSRLAITPPPVEASAAVPPLTPATPNPAVQPNATAVPLPVPEPVRWKHRRAVAIVALVLVVGATGFLLRDRLLSRAPTAAVSTPGRSTSLFILPFRNASGESALDWLGPTVANMLRTEVGQSASLRTVSGDRVAQILTDLRIGSDTNLDPATITRLARFGSANTALWGQYVKFGSEIRIDATLQDLTTERTVALKAQAANEADLPDAIGRLALSVRENLALPPDAVKALAASALRPSSKSVQALRYYNEGVDLSRQGKNLEAVKKFEVSTQEDANFALAYSKLGEAYAALGRAPDAERFSRQAIGLSDALPPQEKYLVLGSRARILNDHQKAIEYYEKLDKMMPGSDEVIFALANLYEDTGAYDKALERFTQLLQHDPKYVDALRGAGRVEYNTGKANEALGHLTPALAIAIQLGNDEAKAAILHELGVTYQLLNKRDDALSNFQQSLEIERRIGRKRGIADDLHGIAQVQDDSGQSDLALESYTDALNLRREIGDKRGIANVLLDLGGHYWARGRYDEALSRFKEALQAQREVHNQTYEALALNNIGAVYLSTGKYDDARTHLEGALALRERINVPLDTADTLHNLGDIELKTGEYEAAVDRYMKALTLRREMGDKRGTAIEQYSLGRLFEYQGRYGAAVDSRTDAVKIFTEIGEGGVWMARSLAGQGSALSQAGQFDDAQNILTQAVTRAQEARNNELVAQVLNLQGDASFYRGDFTAARQRYQQSGDMGRVNKLPEVEMVSRLNLAKVDLREGRSQSPSALQGLRAQAEELGLKYESVQCLLLAGEADLARRQYQSARTKIEEALERADRLGSFTLSAQAHHLLAHTSRMAGDQAGARRHSDKARQILEEIHKQSRRDDVLRRADFKPILDQSTN